MMNNPSETPVAAKPISINANLDTLEGVTAHVFQLSRTENEVVLDCIYLDPTTAAGEAPEILGKRVARINMSQERLVALYQMLKDQLEQSQDSEE